MLPPPAEESLSSRAFPHPHQDSKFLLGLEAPALGKTVGHEGEPSKGGWQQYNLNGGSSYPLANMSSFFPLWTRLCTIPAVLMVVGGGTQLEEQGRSKGRKEGPFS